MSLRDICWLLACTKQRIDQLVAAGVVEKVLAAATSSPRFRASLKTSAKGAPAPKLGRTSASRWRRRNLSLPSGNVTATSELVPTAPAIEAFRGVIRVLRDRMLGLPTRMAPQVHSARSVPETQLVLEEAIREALETASTMSDEDILRRIEQLDRQEPRDRAITGDATMMDTKRSMTPPSPPSPSARRRCQDDAEADRLAEAASHGRCGGDARGVAHAPRRCRIRCSKPPKRRSTAPRTHR